MKDFRWVLAQIFMKKGLDILKNKMMFLSYLQDIGGNACTLQYNILNSMKDEMYISIYNAAMQSEASLTLVTGNTVAQLVTDYGIGDQAAQKVLWDLSIIVGRIRGYQMTSPNTTGGGSQTPSPNTTGRGNTTTSPQKTPGSGTKPPGNIVFAERDAEVGNVVFYRKTASDEMVKQLDKSTHIAKGANNGTPLKAVVHVRNGQKQESFVNVSYPYNRPGTVQVPIPDGIRQHERLAYKTEEGFIHYCIVMESTNKVGLGLGIVFGILAVVMWIVGIFAADYAISWGGVIIFGVLAIVCGAFVQGTADDKAAKKYMSQHQREIDAMLQSRPGADY